MDSQGIQELTAILTRWGWCLAVPMEGDGDEEVRGMIIGTEQYVSEAVAKLKPADTEVVVEEVVGVPV